MKLNKTWKIVIGIASLWVVLYPFLMVGFMFIVFFPTVMTMAGSGSDVFPAPFMAVFMIFWLFAMCSSFLQMAMSAFYLVHIVKNKTGLEILRILCGVGAFFMPYIAMPFYYFVFIWPGQTPDWALERSNPPITAT
ncbi:MAG: hypothetical protein AB1750_18500 [Chloroflexota bacterium]